MFKVNIYIKVTNKNLSVYFHYQQTLFCFIAIILGTETITIIFLKIYFCMRTSSVCRNSTPRWSKSLHRVKFMNVHFLPLSQNGYCINRLVYFFLAVLTNFSASKLRYTSPRTMNQKIFHGSFSLGGL